MKTKAHTCGCGHGTCHTGNNRKTSLRLWFSFAVLISGIACQSLNTAFFRPSWVRLCWFFVGWLSVAIPIMKEAWETIRHKDFFNEFTLMLLASLGAFYIGEYPEAVAVMLFYAVGEMFQDRAVDKARSHFWTGFSSRRPFLPTPPTGTVPSAAAWPRAPAVPWTPEPMWRSACGSENLRFFSVWN